MTHNLDVRRVRRELFQQRLAAFLDAAGWFVVGVGAISAAWILGKALAWSLAR